MLISHTVTVSLLLPMRLILPFFVTAEVGDYDPQDHLPGYVSEFKMLPKQNIKMEEQIQDTHKTLE